MKVDQWAVQESMEATITRRRCIPNAEHTWEQASVRSVFASVGSRIAETTSQFVEGCLQNVCSACDVDQHFLHRGRLHVQVWTVASNCVFFCSFIDWTWIWILVVSKMRFPVSIKNRNIMMIRLLLSGPEIELILHNKQNNSNNNNNKQKFILFHCHQVIVSDLSRRDTHIFCVVERCQQRADGDKRDGHMECDRHYCVDILYHIDGASVQFE